MPHLRMQVSDAPPSFPNFLSVAKLQDTTLHTGKRLNETLVQCVHRLQGNERQLQEIRLQLQDVKGQLEATNHKLEITACQAQDATRENKDLSRQLQGAHHQLPEASGQILESTRQLLAPQYPPIPDRHRIAIRSLTDRLQNSPSTLNIVELTGPAHPEAGSENVSRTQNPSRRPSGHAEPKPPKK